MDKRIEILVAAIKLINVVTSDERQGRCEVGEIAVIAAAISLPDLAPPRPHQADKAVITRGVNAPPGTWPHYATALAAAINRKQVLDKVSGPGRFYYHLLAATRQAFRAEIDRLNRIAEEARKAQEAAARAEAERIKAEVEARKQEALKAEREARRKADEIARAAEEEEKRAEAAARALQNEALESLLMAGESNLTPLQVMPTNVAPSQPLAEKPSGQPDTKKFTASQVKTMMERPRIGDFESMGLWLLRKFQETAGDYSSKELEDLKEAVRQNLVDGYAAQGQSGPDAIKTADATLRRASEQSARRLFVQRAPEREKGAPVYVSPARQQDPETDLVNKAPVMKHRTAPQPAALTPEEQQLAAELAKEQRLERHRQRMAANAAFSRDPKAGAMKRTPEPKQEEQGKKKGKKGGNKNRQYANA